MNTQDPSGSVSLDLSPDLTLDEWRQIGFTLLGNTVRLRFMIGDWVVFGDRKYGESAYADFNKDQYWFVTKCKSIAERVPPENRSEFVVWSKFEAIAALPTDKQVPALDKAQEEGWTSRELRTYVKSFATSQSLKPEPDQAEPEGRDDASPIDRDAEDAETVEVDLNGADILAPSPGEDPEAQADWFEKLLEASLMKFGNPHDIIPVLVERNFLNIPGIARLQAYLAGVENGLIEQFNAGSANPANGGALSHLVPPNGDGDILQAVSSSPPIPELERT